MIRKAASDDEFAAATDLMAEYIDWLPFELDFQDHETELADISRHYAAPLGAVFLAYVADNPVGVVGIRQNGSGIAELKRMYVRESERGRGLGRRLAEEAINFARAAGYRTVRLDSDLESMVAANRLYDSLGFVEIPRHRGNPLRCARFMELQL